MKKRILFNYRARFFLSAAFIFSFAFSAFSDQGVKIANGSGSVTAFTFANAQKLTFLNESMSVIASTGSVSGTFNLSAVSLISFGEVMSSSVRENLQNPSLRVYPNPAVNFISVQGVDAGLVSVYSVVGAKVLSMQLGEKSNQIDVSTLSPGVYILTVNGKSFKFTKK